MKVPDGRHLKLVCAGREPTDQPPIPFGDNDGSVADSQPSPVRATWPTDRQTASRPADTINGEDIIDLAYLSAIVLPKLLIAVGELDIAGQEGNPVAAIIASRQILACALTAKTRADNLEKRL